MTTPAALAWFSLKTKSASLKVTPSVALAHAKLTPEFLTSVQTIFVAGEFAEPWYEETSMPKGRWAITRLPPETAKQTSKAACRNCRIKFPEEIFCAAGSIVRSEESRV